MSRHRCPSCECAAEDNLVTCAICASVVEARANGTPRHHPPPGAPRFFKCEGGFQSAAKACIDCPTDIAHMHGNQKRCRDCSDKARLAWMRQAAARRRANPHAEVDP